VLTLLKHGEALTGVVVLKARPSGELAIDQEVPQLSIGLDAAPDQRLTDTDAAGTIKLTMIMIYFAKANTRCQLSDTS
jgi:hypothetical protein